MNAKKSFVPAAGDRSIFRMAASAGVVVSLIGLIFLSCSAFGRHQGHSSTVYFLENQSFIKLLTEKIEQAEHSVRVATFLFKTSSSKYNYATRLAEDLIRAQKRGVQVEVILELSDYSPSLNESNRRTMKKLRENGITVRFDGVGKQTHVKLVIVDDRYTFIGSHNLSHSALKANNELSLMIDSREIAQKSLAYFNAIE